MDQNIGRNHFQTEHQTDPGQLQRQNPTDDIWRQWPYSLLWQKQLKINGISRKLPTWDQKVSWVFNKVIFY